MKNDIPYYKYASLYVSWNRTRQQLYRNRESGKLYDFSSPGMTDESNAFLCAEINVENFDMLSQAGAVGGELFDGFAILGYYLLNY